MTRLLLLLITMIGITSATAKYVPLDPATKYDQQQQIMFVKQHYPNVKARLKVAQEFATCSAYFRLKYEHDNATMSYDEQQYNYIIYATFINQSVIWSSLEVTKANLSFGFDDILKVYNQTKDFKNVDKIYHDKCTKLNLKTTSKERYDYWVKEVANEEHKMPY